MEMTDIYGVRSLLSYFCTVATRLMLMREKNCLKVLRRFNSEDFNFVRNDSLKKKQERRQNRERDHAWHHQDTIRQSVDNRESDLL